MGVQEEIMELQLFFIELQYMRVMRVTLPFLAFGPCRLRVLWDGSKRVKIGHTFFLIELWVGLHDPSSHIVIPTSYSLRDLGMDTYNYTPTLKSVIGSSCGYIIKSKNHYLFTFDVHLFIVIISISYIVQITRLGPCTINDLLVIVWFLLTTLLSL